MKWVHDFSSFGSKKKEAIFTAILILSSSLFAVGAKAQQSTETHLVCTEIDQRSQGIKSKGKDCDHNTVSNELSTSEKEESQWSKRIRSLIDIYARSNKSPKPIVYPQLKERVENTFLVNAKNHIKIEYEAKGEKVLAKELYYSEGQLVVYSYKEGWNLVSRGGYVYEWKQGETKGLRTKKIDEDLVDYILYLTDPSYIMTSLYYQSQTEPEAYRVKDLQQLPYKEFQAKNPLYGFDSVFVNPDSLWFHGFRPKSADNQDVFTMSISSPQIYEDIPQNILDEMNKVTFEDSKASVRRHMVYL